MFAINVFKKATSVAKSSAVVQLYLPQMQNLDVKETIWKIKKNKPEIKKELEESITNGKRNKNTDIQEKVDNCITNEDAVKLVQESEKIIKSQKSDIIWLAYHQGQIFCKFKEKEQLLAWFQNLM